MLDISTISPLELEKASAEKTIQIMGNGMILMLDVAEGYMTPPNQIIHIIVRGFLSDKWKHASNESAWNDTASDTAPPPYHDILLTSAMN